MKRFKSFLSEMAVITKKASKGDYSAQKTWDSIVGSKFKDTKKLGEMNGYTLFFASEDSYFITNDNNDYLGYLEVRPVSNRVQRIAYADSNMEGGFYKTMFSLIFKFGNVDELYSDISVSENAFKAYSNLVKKKLFNIQVITDKGEYLPFNKKNLTADDYNRVSTKEL